MIPAPHASDPRVGPTTPPNNSLPKEPYPPLLPSVIQQDRDKFLENIQQTPRNVRTHDVYTYVQLITGKIFTD